jgi:hypothetical protein
MYGGFIVASGGASFTLASVAAAGCLVILAWRLWRM